MEPQIQMQGNLVADPKHQTTAGGLSMTRFRIASSGRRFDRARNEFVSTDPVYMSVVCWRHLADHVAATLRKGDNVLVHGRLTFREYDDALGGPRRQTYEVDATSVGPDLGRVVAALTRMPRPVNTVTDPNAWTDAVPAHAQPEHEPTETAA